MSLCTPLTHPVATPAQWLWPSRPSRKLAALHEPGVELTLNGRGALFRALSALRAQGKGRLRVLVPAFHCPSVVSPVLASGLEPVFYRIDRDLGIDWNDVLGLIDRHTLAVLVIRFFGHAQVLSQLTQARQDGVAVVEDWSHSCLDPEGGLFPGDAEHHRIYSLWKLLPSHQGGAWLPARDFCSTLPSLQPAKLQHSMVLLKRFAEESLVQAGPSAVARAVQALEEFRARRRADSAAVAPVEQLAQDHLPLQRQGERYYPFAAERDAVRMPWWVLRVVQATDLVAVARSRRRHYESYARALAGNQTVRPWRTVPPPAAPWVFPVLVDNRDRWDSDWRDRGVPLHTFGIYLHSALFASGASREAIDDALYLSDRLLCLAVHQDLSDSQVARACAVLQAATGSNLL